MDDKTIPLSKLPAGSLPPSKKKHTEAWGENSHYRALFDQTGECVFIIGLDLHYLAANRRALNLLGYEEDELIGMPVSEVMSLGESIGDDILVGDKSSVYERILKRKDGTTLPVEISASIVYNEDNEPAYIQSVARDISERKYSEQALQKHARILSAISDATARLLRSSNIEARIPEVLESLGEAIEAFCCVIFEIHTFSSRPAIHVQYKWNRQNSPDIDIPNAIAPLIPSILKISGINFFNNHEVAPGLSFAIVPIGGTLGSWGFLCLFYEPRILIWSSSEREAADVAANLIGSALQRSSYEETIRLNEARNRIILSAVPDLLIRLDIHDVILDYSANPEHPLYMHREMISGKKLSDIWPEEVVKKILGERSEQGFSASLEVQSFSLPFSNNIYESRLSPIGQKEALLVIRDVTNQARLETMKSDFINRASHELRTPLTTTILMAELIQQGGTKEELDEYWRTLKSELNRQKNLIDTLLMAGRLESGAIKLEAAPMDLIPVLRESVQAIMPIAYKKTVSVHLDVVEESLTVMGEKSGLQQVFINLINNAVKFSPEGSSVEVVVKKGKSESLISITDHGFGIPSEAIPHLFERFYRAKNVTIAEIPGSGIGLYIVKSIVSELGGTIEVESELKKGTTFIVHLRLAPQKINSRLIL